MARDLKGKVKGYTNSAFNKSGIPFLYLAWNVCFMLDK